MSVASGINGHFRRKGLILDDDVLKFDSSVSSGYFKLDTTPVKQAFENVYSVALTDAGAVTTAGGVVKLQNPETTSIIVTQVIVDLTTAATAAATVDIGTDTDGTTSSDNLIDGLDINAATGVFDNITDGGTNGKTRQKLGADEYIVATVKTGDMSDAVGTLYIKYVKLSS